MKFLMAAIAALFFASLASPAEAKSVKTMQVNTCNDRGCFNFSANYKQNGRSVAKRRIARKAASRPALDANGNRGFCQFGPNRGSISLAPVVQPLKSKIEEIVNACGSKVVSTGCRGGVTPNHREWKAVDVKGNPSCIYARLKGWPGGYSVDYSAVQHVHISYSRKYEWGVRFRHRANLYSAVSKFKTRVVRSTVSEF